MYPAAEHSGSSQRGRAACGGRRASRLLGISVAITDGACAAHDLPCVYDIVPAVTGHLRHPQGGHGTGPHPPHWRGGLMATTTMRNPAPTAISRT